MLMNWVTWFKKCKNTYHRKWKPIDVKSKTYINFNKENISQDLKWLLCEKIKIHKKCLQ